MITGFWIPMRRPKKWVRPTGRFRQPRIGVVVGYSGPVGMLNSPHVQMAEIVLEKGYLHIL
jgi:hypothetical protein